MEDIYNYRKHVKVVTTPSGDKVITMNEAIFTSMIIALYEGKEHQEQDNRDATAKSTLRLINALLKGE